MRALLLLAAIVLVLMFVGWISFSKGPNKTSINIESDKIRQDTKEIMGSGAQMLHKAGDEIEAKAEREPNRVPGNPETAPATR